MIVDEKECLYLSLIFLLIICFGCRIFERIYIIYVYIVICVLSVKEINCYSYICLEFKIFFFFYNERFFNIL